MMEGLLLIVAIVVVVYLVRKSKKTKNAKDNVALGKMSKVKRQPQNAPAPSYAQGNNTYKCEKEQELLRRASFDDTEAMKALISVYWFGDDEDIQLDKSAARGFINRVEDLAKQHNRLAMGFVASHYRLYNLPEGPPEDFPMFDETLVKKCYEQILKEAKAENPKSMLAASICHLITPKSERLKYLLRSAELGCQDAYYFLMDAYYWADYRADRQPTVQYPNDYGISKDGGVDLTAEMLKWGALGAESNSMYADKCQVTLAWHYFHLRDSSLDSFDEKSGKIIYDNNPYVMRYLSYMKMAAKSGNLEAIRRLREFG